MRRLNPFHVNKDVYVKINILLTTVSYIVSYICIYAFALIEVSDELSQNLFHRAEPFWQTMCCTQNSYSVSILFLASLSESFLEREYVPVLIGCQGGVQKV